MMQASTLVLGRRGGRLLQPAMLTGRLAQRQAALHKQASAALLHCLFQRLVHRIKAFHRVCQQPAKQGKQQAAELLAMHKARAALAAAAAAAGCWLNSEVMLANKQPGDGKGAPPAQLLVRFDCSPGANIGRVWVATTCCGSVRCAQLVHAVAAPSGQAFSMRSIARQDANTQAGVLVTEGQH